MKIHLVEHTPNPAAAIAASFVNMGIGMDVKALNEMTEEQVNDAISEIFKSHLTQPLEFASFNFFWEDLPIFMRAQLVRHRVGWGYAERSLRFYDANLKSVVKDYAWEAMPTIKDRLCEQDTKLKGLNLRDLMENEMARQMEFYDLLLKEGVDQQDARNVIGVWYPTSMQTTCNYRALRDMLASRLSSQAHPFWRKAAQEIKRLVTEVSPVLGAGLTDVCDIAGRCVWNSRFDRDCDDCIARKRKVAHTHQWTRHTTQGDNTQCDCGVLKPVQLLKS
jgi:flavin-dependent thymidylate synthase